MTLTLEPGLPPCVPMQRARYVGNPAQQRHEVHARVGGAITLRARADPAGLIIEVQDTRAASRPWIRERAFEPFTQLDSALSRRFPGSGLAASAPQVLKR